MKIVHVIDSLALGGTENQFLSLLPDLARDHEIVLVTMSDADRPALPDLPVAKRHNLGFSGPGSLLAAILRLRKIISREQPDLVRSQLFWSSVIARLATPRRIPLIFSIHSTMSADGYANSRATLWLEKLTYQRHHRLISVSGHALDDFDRHVGLKGPAEVLTNFVPGHFLTNSREGRPFAPPYRLVAVGNLKPVKNHAVLIEALQAFPSGVQLDIYGEGDGRSVLERQIASSGAAIRLMGAVDQLWNVLPDYDLFVMPSLYEGCPNAAIEAMAAGLPLLLSDIPVMHEVSHGNALFFDPTKPESLTQQIKRILAGEVDLSAMAKRGREIVSRYFLKEKYLERLNAIYANAVVTAGKPVDALGR